MARTQLFVRWRHLILVSHPQTVPTPTRTIGLHCGVFSVLFTGALLKHHLTALRAFILPYTALRADG